MTRTDNINLNTISEDYNSTVLDFFQKIAGTDNNSNMEIIDDEFEKYAKIDDLDSTGAVREAGGIVPYVDYVAQTESDVLVVTMTYTNGFECDVSFAQITSAYNSGKTCMLYANTGTNGGNKCVYMLGYLDGDQAIFTAVADSQLYQFRIGSDNTIIFSQTSLGTVTNISDSVTTESSETAASSTAVKTAYDAAMAAKNAIPELSSSVSNTSTTTAATSSAVKQAYDLANQANNTANSAKITPVNSGITLYDTNNSGAYTTLFYYMYGDAITLDFVLYAENANSNTVWYTFDLSSIDSSIASFTLNSTIYVPIFSGNGHYLTGSEVLGWAFIGGTSLTIGAGLVNENKMSFGHAILLVRR